MDDNPLVAIGLPVSLFIIMVGMGLSLGAKDFRRIAEQPRGVAVGTFVQLLLIPLLGFGLGWLSGGGMLAVGVVLVAVLPGGTTSNLLCFLGKANLALSITLTVTASLITSVTVPLYLDLALELFVDETSVTAANVQVESESNQEVETIAASDGPAPVAHTASPEIKVDFVETLMTMLIIVVVPVILGMIVNAVAPAFAKKMEPIIGLFSLLVLLLIIALIVWTERDNLPSIIAMVWKPTLALNVLSIFVGLAAGRLSGLSPKDTVTVAIEASIKNTTLGLTIALSVLRNNELAMPAAAFGLLMYASVALLTMYSRTLADTETASVGTDDPPAAASA